MVDRTKLLAQVARMYYEDSATQVEIARQIDTSRSTVSRMLQEARDSGIVEIVVHDPWRTVPRLENELAKRFRIRRARVLRANGAAYEEILRGLGWLAASYLDDILVENTILGISWGKAVYHTVRALRTDRETPITVVQMVGAVGEGDPLIDGPDLARVLAGVYGGEYRYLHAPLIVEDIRSRDVLLQEPRIQRTLALARRADVALVGIGAPEPEVYSLLRAGYVEEETLSRLRARGVVGDICALHYDASGRLLDVELNQRVVGIDLEALHDVGQVIGVAGGTAKARALLGALRGGHINVLVTDDATARRILALDRSASHDVERTQEVEST
jgi:DNA-binding transcriptional regulator LsrR (DeoR family)